jgi:peptidoglycan-associated lipoprotein
MNRIVMWGVLAVVTIGLAGCPKRPQTPPASTPGQAVAPQGANAAGAGGNESNAAEALGGEGANPGARVAPTTVYFDFDSAEIKPEFAALIAAHGRHMAQTPTLRIRLEGNTDERGSPEYNIGLGERRAQAVKQALVLQGGRADQMVTVSYGQERPAVAGHTEDAWAKNRRVEIVYLTP